MYNERFSTDDVLIRDVLLGLLDLLNRKVVINQVISNEEIRKISVPFMPFAYGQERFLQDFFLRYGVDCDGPALTEGNVDVVPRGVVHVDSITINSAALVNKFVRASFARPVRGETGQSVMQQFSAHVNQIPLTLAVSCEIKSNTVLEAIQIIEQFISTFYRAKAYTVENRGFPVETRVGFSNDYSVDKPITFTYGDDTTVSIKIPMEIETYLVVVDPTTEMPASTSIAGFHTGYVSGVSGYSGYSGASGMSGYSYLGTSVGISQSPPQSFTQQSGIWGFPSGEATE